VLFSLSLILSDMKGGLNILNNRVVQLIGKVSYSAYILHFIILLFLEKLGFLNWAGSNKFGFPITILVLLGLTTIFSLITYRFIEQPGQNVGRWLIAKWERIDV
jgi:peptidoglycan/LPS O-acetylase OafA/YrhL